MKYIKNMISKSFLISITLMGGGLLASCSDDKDPESYDISNPLPAPENLTNNEDEATYSSLSFSWNAVKNAVQYGYDVKNMEGTSVAGGVTTKTYAAVEDLEPYTDYTISVYSMPAVGNGGVSIPSTIKVKTPFYPVVTEATTTCTSYLRSANGNEYSGVMTEDRSYEGWKEGWFGYFTIKGFYGSKGSLTFKVNSNYTITILNSDYTPLSADSYDEDGLVKVATGYSMPQTLKTLYINEGSSVFDPENSTLSFIAKLSNTDADIDVITW